MTTQLSRIETDILQVLSTLRSWTANWLKLDALSAAVANDFAALNTRLDKIELDINGDLTPPPTPASAASDFGPPVYRKGKLVATYDLKNDTVVGPVTNVMKDDEGTVVPSPPTAAFTGTVSDVTLLNLVQNDGTHFTINALKRAGTVTIAWHEAANLVPDYTDMISIVEDFTPASADSDFSNATITPQPLPAA